MPRSVRRQVVRVALLVSVASATCLAIWGAWEYVALVRQDVAVADAAVRVDVASRHRLALVANLLQDLASSEAEPVIAARQAVLHTALPVLDVAGYEVRQRELTQAIEACGAGGTDVSSQSLERARQRLDEALARFSRSLARREAARRRFPDSVIAGFRGLEVRAARAR